MINPTWGRPVINKDELTIDQAVEILSSLRGEYVWFVRSGDYGVLRLDFGNPHLTVREPSPTAGKSERLAIALQRRLVVPAGKWHLFIEFGLWSVEAGGFRCSRLDGQFDERAFGQLDGQKLISVAYTPESAEWVFRFDLSGVLSVRCRHLDAERYDQWMLFFENGGCLYCENTNRIFLEREALPDN
ncbi:MAG: hypothetical protein ACLPSF_03010 [Methylocella sp.]